MKVSVSGRREGGFEAAEQALGGNYRTATKSRVQGLGSVVSMQLNGWLDVLAPSPWSAHVGLSAVGAHIPVVNQPAPNLGLRKTAMGDRPHAAAPLYTPAERRRRDATPWTLVQAILAPVQFLVFAVSLALIARYMLTGEGYGLATASILAKTVLLYTIMITGSIWEKVVFGKWLFAKAFFWEDVFSMLVLGLQTTYLVALWQGWGTAGQQMMIAVAAYAAYAVNASQFLLKLRAARLEGGAALPVVAV